jgi:hypothetical protein
VGAARDTSGRLGPEELRRLEQRRSSLAAALRAWRKHRPFADRTLALEKELREVDFILSRLDRLRYQ